MEIKVSKIKKELNQIFNLEMKNLLEESSFISEFHLGISTQKEFYKRHILETLLRIQINNDVDAYCLYKLGKKQQTLAGRLATYLVEEYGHDKLFQKDLSYFGMTQQDIENSQPFRSTYLLMDYLKGSIDRDGAIPTVVWNYFVELYSDTYNQTITSKAASEFGSSYVNGSQSHLDIDELKDHVGLMEGMLSLSIKSSEDLELAKEYMTTFIYLISLYFKELYQATKEDKHRVAS